MSQHTGALLFAMIFASCAAPAPAAGQEAWPTVPIDKDQQRTLNAEWLSQFGKFEQQDLNHDGGVDREENRRTDWLLRLKYDFDESGALSWPEYLVGVCRIPTDPALKSTLTEGCLKKGRRDFDRLEKSGDGVLSYEEVAPMADSIFETFKLCKDGKHRPKC
jgi:hypothetical protein